MFVSTSDALRAPAALGVKATATEHVAPMATLEAEQVSVVTAKSLAFVPVMVAAPAPKVNVSDPELVTVNVVAEDVVPVVTVPNDPDEGATETAGAATCTEPIVNAPKRVTNVWSSVIPVERASGAPFTRMDEFAGTSFVLSKAPKPMAESVARRI